MSANHKIDPITGHPVSDYGYVKKEEIINASLSYIGISSKGNDTSAATWQIVRKSTVGNVITYSYPNDDASFSYVWDDRASYFVRIFTNTYSISFNGADEYINLGNPSDLNLSVNFSISAWFKTSNIAANKEIIGKYGSTAADRSYFIGVSGTTGYLRVYLYSAGGVKDYSSSVAYNDGAWHHVCITFSANLLKIYVDGAEITPTKTVDGTVTAIQTNTSATYLGALPAGSPTQYWNGNLDEICIVDKALSLGEVQELYNSGSPGDVAYSTFSSDVISWWRMGDGDVVPTIYDSVGNNDGTAVNMDSGNVSGDTP